MDRQRKIKVLVVDDSAVIRKLISRLLNEDSEIEVIATAIDGDFAISKIDQLRPDVVTLDVDMPRMDGIATLRQIVSKHRIPVVMLSSLTTRGAALTMKALELGAVDFICKPRSASRVGDLADELIQKVRAAARSTVVSPSEPPTAPEKPKKSKPVAEFDVASGKIVAIGASSGGPNALRYVLPRIPPDFGAGIVIVQHLPESFTGIMAKWLDEICQVEVKEAKAGDLILPGRVLIAPGNMHLKVKKGREGNFIVLEHTAPVGGHMPSVDVFFRSVAQEYGSRATAVIMTGMGSDGADAIGEVKRAGGLTLAQDKASCAIFGMPKAAIDRGHVDRVVSLNELADYLISVVGRYSKQEVLDGARI
ncbi:MAG TPA: chemotaxis response regulator protein-glutamate methylesterase [Blastocatellia bacterium]|nr:chemotaxis response regulator protein-glutamate methylesterase [Blastocatellia bacterium]